MKSPMNFFTLLIAAGMTIFTVHAAAEQGPSPRVAVTDLAYAQEVAQYFNVSKSKGNNTLNANAHSVATTSSESGTYAEGAYSYIEQRELGGFTNDIRGALLKGTSFRLVQGKVFDAGTPQSTKAEQVLNQIQTGKIASSRRQPEVKDIIARIKKGEFNGADYVLFGTLTSIEFRDQLSPLQGTTSNSYMFSLDVVADFSLISTRNYEIKAAFSAQGAGNDTKLISNRGDIVRPNRGKVIRETSQTLASNVFEQIADQIASSDRNLDRNIRGLNNPGETRIGRDVRAGEPEQVIILK